MFDIICCGPDGSSSWAASGPRSTWPVDTAGFSQWLTSGRDGGGTEVDAGPCCYELASSIVTVLMFVEIELEGGGDSDLPIGRANVATGLLKEQLNPTLLAFEITRSSPPRAPPACQVTNRRGSTLRPRPADKHAGAREHLRLHPSPARRPHVRFVHLIYLFTALIACTESELSDWNEGTEILW